MMTKLRMDCYVLWWGLPVVLIELVEQIFAKPGMYIGNPSVGKMKAMVDGYTIAASEAKNPGELLDFDQESFSGFVRARLGIEGSGYGWCSAVLMASEDGDGEQALAKLGELFREWRNCG